MKKIQTFLNAFIKSIISVDYYKDIVKAHVSFSMKYFFVLLLLGTVVASIATYVRIIPDVEKGINELTMYLQTAYPEDLIFTMKDSALSINQPEPYFFSIPEKYKTPNTQQQIENIITFDSDGTIDDLDEYKTFVLINSKNIITKNNNKLEVYPLENIPDGNFTINEYMEVVNGLYDIEPLIKPAVAIGLILGLGFYLLFSKSLYIVGMGVVAMLLGNIFRLVLNYSKYVQLVIHTMTLPFLISIGEIALNMPISIPFWFSGLNILFIVIVFNVLKENNSKEAITPTEVK